MTKLLGTSKKYYLRKDWVPKRCSYCGKCVHAYQEKYKKAASGSALWTSAGHWACSANPTITDLLQAMWDAPLSEELMTYPILVKASESFDDSKPITFSMKETKK